MLNRPAESTKPARPTDAELAKLPIECLRTKLANAGPRDKTVQTKFTIATARMCVDAADALEVAPQKFYATHAEADAAHAARFAAPASPTFEERVARAEDAFYNIYDGAPDTPAENFSRSILAAYDKGFADGAAGVSEYPTIQNRGKRTMVTTAEPLVKLLTDRDVSAVTGAARSTLAKMRLRGDGPKWVRIGTSVRYPEDSLRDWLASLPRQAGVQ